jgi:biopolymer transport protein ExbB/TolQ
MSSNEAAQSALFTAVGVIVAIGAVVGTQLLGWEWGSGQLMPTAIGVAVAGIAVAVAVKRRLS